jgi:hypothetical protein
MTLSDYKTTIGGAFSALGTTLVGVGVVPQLSGGSNELLTHIAIVGFFCTAIGQFLGHLFAADSKTVRDLSEQVDNNTKAIAGGSGAASPITPTVPPSAPPASTSIPHV